MREVLAAGMKTPARPTDMSTIAGNTMHPVRRVLVDLGQQHADDRHARDPGSMSALGPTRGSSLGHEAGGDDDAEAERQEGEAGL